jgi:FkbM family methyltransferase
MTTGEHFLALLKLVKTKDFVPPIFAKVYMAVRMFQGGRDFPKIPKEVVLDPVFNSFSDGHTDILVDLLLGCKADGHYVDIGAHDDEFPNNTHRFYARGWSGINIEPQQEPFENLRKARLRDINLQAAISDHTGKMQFLKVGSDHRASTLERRVIKRYSKLGKRGNLCEVNVTTLKDVFDKHAKWPIDFMSIDVEGHEMKVLQGNDWSRYRPTVILSETSFDGEGKIARFLKDRGYKQVYSSFIDDIFMVEP